MADEVPVLAARGIVVEFGGLRALSGVDLEIPESTIVGVVGPNGAGKSTLFAVLSGLLRANAGRVWFRGEDISRDSPASRARAGIARTFQHPELFAGLSVREHLQLAYRMCYKRSRIWTDLLRPSYSDRAELERCDHLLALLGLVAYADGPVLGLPLGVSRLIEVGRALALSPAVLLLDEPLAGLDAVATRKLVEVLLDIAKLERIAIVIVEHDFDTVSKIANSLIVLDFGEVIASGPPALVRNLPKVSVAYLGE